MPILRPEERVGSVLAERYRLDRILGKGGMGVVFAGLHTWTNRPIAVKLLLPQYAENSELLKRFFREARAAAALRHPHVIEVIDMGEDDSGEAYIVLEYLEGEPMSALLKRDGAIDFGTLLEIVLPVMDALAEAHARGILHRDLKPDNIYLTKGLRGRKVPKLLDFGIAKLLESETIATGTGGVLGTPAYMAPEQARGDKALDPRVDVWSMGVVCFQALSGRLPFVADTPTVVLAQILTQPAPPVRDVAPDLHPAVAKVIDRALASNRDERLGSMAETMKVLIDAALEMGIELDASLLEYRDREAPAAPATRPSRASNPEPAPVAAEPAAPIEVEAVPETPVPAPEAVAETRAPVAVAPVAKRRSPWLLIAGAVLGLGSCIGCGTLIYAMGGDTHTVEITSESDRPIVSFYLRPTGRTQWGMERLGGVPLTRARPVTLQDVACDSYDVRFVDADGLDCVLNDTSLCSGAGAFQVIPRDFSCREPR